MDENADVTLDVSGQITGHYKRSNKFEITDTVKFEF